MTEGSSIKLVDRVIRYTSGLLLCCALSACNSLHVDNLNRYQPQKFSYTRQNGRYFHVLKVPSHPLDAGDYYLDHAQWKHRKGYTYEFERVDVIHNIGKALQQYNYAKKKGLVPDHIIDKRIKEAEEFLFSSFMGYR